MIPSISEQQFSFFVKFVRKREGGSDLFFLLKKRAGKKMNWDFIKGGRGGSPFYDVISQKIFNFTKDGFPYVGFDPLTRHLPKNRGLM